MDEVKRYIDTAGGDAGRDIDKRQGNFTERDFYGTSVYANHGTITNFFETQKRIAQAEFCRIGLPEQIYQQSLMHREEVLQKLAEVVLQTDGPRLTVLHGMPGIGKTSLLAQFTRSISEEQFNNGVLWGNLALLAPHELLSRFLALLPEESGITSTRLDASLRDVFWKRLCGNGAKWLVIIDHVRDRQQLTELLPGSEEILGQSRICLIAHEPFELYLGESQATIHEIKSLTPKEAETFLKNLLTTRRKNGSTRTLQRIGELVEYNTQMLVSCANLVNSGVTDLERLVEGLRDRGLSQSLLSASQQRTLDLIVGDLDERTRALIPYLGALGAGDWSPKMLASIALWTPAEVVEAVQPLVEARLIVRFDTNHYRTTFLLRQYAVGLLDQGDPYRALSAYILLARFCLDQAQDLEAELRTHSSKKGEPSVTLSELDPLFIKEFRRGLTLELPHIRHVLSWAGRKGQWELVRRFSYLPYLETVQHFTADGFEITTSLFMANIWEPTVWPPNRPAFIRIPILEHTEDWTIFPPPMRELSSGDVSVIEGHESSDDLSGDSLPERCRLNWTVIASHIVAAVFRETCLTEARWTGVQARGLILAAGCDAVGAVMQACDLSDSVWVQTDARYARLDGSSLRGALLRHVQLTGASLRGVDFTGAILENVQLRGADLQDADFTGAVLVNTTLRGAQLQQAIFCDAILSYVDLQQAKLNPHQLWQAHTLDKISSEDPEIRHAKGVQKSQRSSNRYQERSNWFAPKQSMPKRHKPPQDLRGYEQKQLQLAEVDLPGADLRAVILPEASLEGAFLNGACLRGGSLPKARLNNAKLQGIDGRAIDLRGSTLDDTDLTESNLRDARLQGATLHRAKLVRADLGNADLGEADLSHADLSQCSAPYTCWKGARLTNAKLTNARFCYADLQDVDFTGAATDLKAADLTGANLRGATIDLSLLYTTASLSQAILPDGTKVATYRGEYNGQLPHISSDLRFSHWEGQFLLFTLEVEQELDGARLNGIFVNVTFSNLILTNAHLSGNFSGTNFVNVSLRNSSLSGAFDDVTFLTSDFTKASLQRASLVCCTLTGTNLSDDQLRKAQRLRGTILPNGSLYEGQFNLLGDREDAIATGMDPDDVTAMSGFCRSREPIRKRRVRRI